MWTKKLENKIAKHRALGKEILDYANSILGVSVPGYTSVNDLAVDLETQKKTGTRQQKIREQNNRIFKKKIPKKMPFRLIKPPKIPVSFIEELEKMIEEYRQEEIEIEKLKPNVQVPDYMKRLIDVGLVYPPDGRRVVGKLNEVAEFLVDVLKMELTWRFLKETFLQDDGSEWGDGTVTLALKMANSINKE